MGQRLKQRQRCKAIAVTRGTNDGGAENTMVAGEVFRSSSKYILKIELINKILGMKMYIYSFGGMLYH